MHLKRPSLIIWKLAPSSDEDQAPIAMYPAGYDRHLTVICLNKAWQQAATGQNAVSVAFARAAHLPAI